MKAKLFVILGLIALPIVATVAMSSHQSIPAKTDIVNVNITKTDIGKYLGDRALCLKVKAKLAANSLSNISTSCRKGQVTLSGFVANWKRKNQAAALTKEVDGVKSVINKIIVKPDNTKPA